MKSIDKKTWILTGVMFVVILLLTWLVRIDTTYGSAAIVDGKPVYQNAGYINLGDAAIYVAAVLLGGPLGALVSGLGAMFGDLFTGHTEYMFITLIIKAAMAFFVAWYIKRGEGFKHRLKTLVIAGAIMMLMYFLFDLTILGNFTRAATGFFFNLIQAVACGAVALLVLLITGTKQKGAAKNEMDFRSTTPSSGSGRNLK